MKLVTIGMLLMWALHAPTLSCMTNEADTKTEKKSEDAFVTVDDFGNCNDQKNEIHRDIYFLADVERALKKIKQYGQQTDSNKRLVKAYRAANCGDSAPQFDPVVNFVDIIEYLLEGSRFSDHYEEGDEPCSQEAVLQALTNRSDGHFNVANMSTKDGRTVVDIVLGRIGSEYNDAKKISLLENMVYVLLMCGAPADQSFHKAVEVGNVNVCKMLLNNPHARVNHKATKADINAQNKDKNNETPLHVAARCGHSKLCPWLISHEADLDAQDNKGAVPLTYAAKAGHKDTYQMLVDAGAKTNILDVEGNTPEYYGSLKYWLLAGVAKVTERLSEFQLGDLI